MRGLYGWRGVPKLVAWTLGLALAIVVLPIVAVAIGSIVFPIDFVMKMVGLGGAGGLVTDYLQLAERAFAPDALPTWLPRLAVLVLGAAGAAALADGWMHGDRSGRGAFWWLMVRPPLSAAGAIDHCWQVMWDLVRGAANVRMPTPAELGRRYTELLADNVGQPGFRELLLSVHDIDAHRDLMFALVGEGRRRRLVPAADLRGGRERAAPRCSTLPAWPATICATPSPAR